MKIWLYGALVCSAIPTVACINDRDTLAQEAAATKANSSGLPHVVRVITGRFERYPTRYYQMRLERVGRELKANPSQLALYDDAGAASDRLMRSSEAIEWMNKKRQQLEVSKLDAKSKREHWYRYYANIGTFYAHRWLRSGANRQNLDDLKRGRDLIKQAIVIKPNAHFGREKYQLKLMEWALNPPKPQKDHLYNDFLGLSEWNQDDNENHLKSTQYSDAVTGLSGLIVLGDAWASLDVYHALMQALGAEGKAALSNFAGQRCLELLENGKGSLSPYFGNGYSSRWNFNWPQSEASSEDFSKKYFELRTDAMKYQEERNYYMYTRFEKGLHPDTHPNFWKAWKEPPLPSLDMPTDTQQKTVRTSSPSKSSIIMGSVVFISALATFLLGLFIGRRQKNLNK